MSRRDPRIGWIDGRMQAVGLDPLPYRDVVYGRCPVCADAVDYRTYALEVRALPDGGIDVLCCRGCDGEMLADELLAVFS